MAGSVFMRAAGGSKDLGPMSRAGRPRRRPAIFGPRARKAITTVLDPAAGCSGGGAVASIGAPRERKIEAIERVVTCYLGAGIGISAAVHDEAGTGPRRRSGNSTRTLRCMRRYTTRPKPEPDQIWCGRSARDSGWTSLCGGGAQPIEETSRYWTMVSSTTIYGQAEPVVSCVSPGVQRRQSGLWLAD